MSNVTDLIAKLEDADNKVRLSAVINLGRLKDPQAALPLLARLVTRKPDGRFLGPVDPDVSVRIAAAAVLGTVAVNADFVTRNTVIIGLKAVALNDSSGTVTRSAQRSYEWLLPLYVDPTTLPPPPPTTKAPAKPRSEESAPGMATRDKVLLVLGLLVLSGGVTALVLTNRALRTSSHRRFAY